MESGNQSVNFMRQYYDVYSLLENQEVLTFIGTQEYYIHKEKRFSNADKVIPIKENQAFILGDKKIRDSFIKRYKETEALYYNGQPDFNELMKRVSEYLHRL